MLINKSFFDICKIFSMSKEALKSIELCDLLLIGFVCLFVCIRIEEKDIDTEKEAAMEAELKAARERAVVPQEARMSQFKDMLLERGVKHKYVYPNKNKKFEHFCFFMLLKYPRMHLVEHCKYGVISWGNDGYFEKVKITTSKRFGWPRFLPGEIFILFPVLKVKPIVCF